MLLTERTWPETRLIAEPRLPADGVRPAPPVMARVPEVQEKPAGLAEVSSIPALTVPPWRRRLAPAGNVNELVTTSWREERTETDVPMFVADKVSPAGPVMASVPPPQLKPPLFPVVSSEPASMFHCS